MKRPDMNRYEDAWTAEVYDYEIAGDWGIRDVGFYLSLANELPGPVLELACGTGRVALPLARGGARVIGLDISPHMLAVAQRKLDAEEPAVRERVRLVQADMSSFALRERFALILIPFRAFQALLTRDEQRGCLRCCREHLLADGRLAINVFNPRLSRLVSSQAAETPEEFAGPDGTRVVWSADTTFDSLNQTLSSAWRYECTPADGETTVREHLLELRYFFRCEMEWMLEACGFEVEALYGGFDRSEFTAESSEMIFVARRA
jgi:SAM-dependent methyltransferase